MSCSESITGKKEDRLVDGKVLSEGDREIMTVGAISTGDRLVVEEREGEFLDDCTAWR